MNNSIRILSDSLINKIKAGEVIESPVSVVKELVENSIDAGAAQIYVSIVEGGLDEILVSDNGSGMSETDALLSIQRHATSKLTCFSDLESLRTMGFRGEALAAISSIAKLEIITKRVSDSHAVRIYSEGSKICESGFAARESGTSLCVRNLFYNVPARKNFQKSTSNLIRAISQELRKIAIAYPEIHFSLYSDNKELWEAHVPRQIEIEDLHLHRIREVLHTNLIDNGFTIDRVHNSFTIRGVTSSPTLTRTNKKEQYLIVNRRVVSCEEIDRILVDIYGTLIPTNRFPCYVIYITLPPHCIDVNVHPQKRFIKIKVQERADIQKFIKEAFVEILYGNAAWKAVQPEKIHYEFSTPSYSRNSFRLCESKPRVEAPCLQLTFSIKDRIIGVFNHYLLLKSDPHLLLFDLQGAQEFLALTQINNAIAKGIVIETQSLLLPISLEWSLNEFEWLESHQSKLKNFGFLLECIPPNMSKITSIPLCIHQEHIKDWLLSIMNDRGASSHEIEITLAKRLVQFTKKKSKFTVLDAETLYNEVEKVSLDYPSLLGFSLYSEINYENITQLFRAHSQATNPIEK
ncbi:MAG: DNA mismatch repair endonuclease MutL [Chlamydiales bacterium]